MSPPSATTATPPDRSRLVSLDVLRGLAALGVVLYHFTHGAEGRNGYPDSPWLAWLGQRGYLGVYVFFVVSGFVIPWTMDRGGYRLSDAGRFFVKRGLRLHPLYLLCLGLAVVPAAVESGSLPRGWWAHPLLLNDVLGLPWVLEIYWTLALEAQFYIGVAVLFPLMAHRRTGVRWGTLAGICALALAFPSQVWVAHYGAIFSCGILAFWKLSGRAGERAFVAGLAGVAGVVYLTHGLLNSVVATSAALVIVHVPLRGRPFLWLGAVSYPLYLIHLTVGGIINSWAAGRARHPVQDTLTVLLAVSLSLLAAWVLHRLVELPSRRWSSALRYRRGVSGAK